MKVKTEEEIKKSIKEHGIGNVVCWYSEQLPESFFDSLSFDEWKDIEWETSIHGKKALADRALEEMTKIASTYKEWYGVYFCALCKKTKEKELINALEKMLETAELFDEYMEVHRSAPKGHSLRERALKKMAEMLKPYM